MKNVKISDDIHKQIKQISSQEGMTMDGVLRDLLQVEKAEYQKADSPGSNIVQEGDTTISTSQVEKGAEYQNAEYQEDAHVSRKEFDEALGGLHKWTKKLVEEYIEFCPDCDHLLYLHVQSHTGHKFYPYLGEAGLVSGEGDYYHLECPRCGYHADLKQPKWRQHENGEKKVLDLRNAEGRGEGLAG